MSVFPVKERPILFNGEMVRAILDGRKTVTRRPLKLPHDFWESSVSGGLVPIPMGCPYGKPGERLWVRETWAADAQLDSIAPRKLSPGEPIRYHADGQVRQQGCAMISVGKSRPNIFMPRWACRILLEVTEVRVERLQDITEEQARAEGITDGGCTSCGNHEPCGCECPSPDAVDSFVHLWNSTGGDWGANPWVWVIEFKQIDAHQPPR